MYSQFFKTGKFRGIVFLLFILGVFIRPDAALSSPFHLPPGFFSASHSEEAFAPLVNPVFSDVPGSSVFSYSFYNSDKKSEANHFVQTGGLGFSFIYSWYDYVYDNTGSFLNANASLFSINKGFFFRDIFGIGLGYSFSAGGEQPYRGYKSWNMGLLFRPFRYVSFGFAMNDVWAEINGGSLNSREVYSMSVRPFTERLTVSFDLIRQAGDRFRDLEYRIFTQLRIPCDILLDVSFDSKKDLMIGLSMPFYLRSGRAVSPSVNFYRSVNRSSVPDFTGFSAAFSSSVNKSAIMVPALSRTFLHIRIDSTIREIEVKSFFKKRSVVFYDILRSIRRAENDRGIDGIILHLDSPGLGFAQIQELRCCLKNFRKRSSKPVYSVLTASGNTMYYLAAAADKIYFTPADSFSLTGLEAGVYFIKGLLDKAGVKFESVKNGRYKSFDEAFTRMGMSDEFRENMTSLVSDLNEQYVNDIVSDRGIDISAVQDLFKIGLISPSEAKQKSFVDDIKYYDEVIRDMQGDISTVDLETYMAEKAREHSWGHLPMIAVVYADGNIIRGKSVNSAFRSALGDVTFENTLEKVFSDDSVRAVVIRINSGGGSALASDYMLNAVRRMKKKYKKPVVYSFGNMAASGGYYIACTGDSIFAERGTVAGSIGVVAGKISASGLYAMLGIKKDVIKMSRFADMFSESRDFTKDERKVLKKGTDFVYDRFTGLVMQARKIDKKGIRDAAEGRVFTGRQAEKLRLADKIGGLISAIEYAVKLGKIKGDYITGVYPDGKSFELNLFQSAELSVLSRYIGTIVKNINLPSYGNESRLYLCPYMLEIK